ncbi:putative carboxypeptidase YocD [Phytophthora citrophthora]|uniref:Carboxypeptidase YocD n=1 Tax=Phytophthora citrophthora TaxID=4793 RepID=A0AAD9G281_9STRA|nr:putative carboxypeptidase YocD [Phytophthora citrophthora]
MSSLLRGTALVKGDTIALVAPASGLAALVLHRLDKARQELERLGFCVKIYVSVSRTIQENVTKFDENVDDARDRAFCSAYSSADAETRANELMQAFQDPEVAAIICTIGGFTSHEILEYLDFDAIAAHPKIFCGFSDITTLHLALYAKTNLCSFYGPAAIVQFGEFPEPLAYTVESFLNAVQSSEPLGDIIPSDEWTEDKTANWYTRADISHRDLMKHNLGYTWLRSGSAQGRILGGCLPTLLQVRGTEYMPDLQDAILLIETPEGAQFDQGMALSDINVALGWLRADGTFKKIRGLVVGRAFAYSEKQVEELQGLIRHHTRGTTFPILYGVDVGHTNPIATVPLGCQVELDATANSFRIVESGVVGK